MIIVRRVYNLSSPSPTPHFLVDRMWPRGFTKEKLAFAPWMKGAAPSRELCAWYAHQPEKWDEFRARYYAELDAHPESWLPLLAAARQGDLTLLFAARDAAHSNAAALKAFLEDKLQGG